MGKISKKTLSAALTLSFVLGCYGNAWATSVYGATEQGTDSSLSNVECKDGTKVHTGFSDGTPSESKRSDNVFTVKGGSWDTVYGGYDGDGGITTNNSVTITGSTTANAVYGGYAFMHSACNNSVTITGGSIASVYGGYSESEEVANNTVNLGGYIDKDDKVVTNAGQANITAAVYGGYSRVPFVNISGNTLNVFSVNNSVGAIGMSHGKNSFQHMNFYIPEGTENHATMLTVDSTVNMTGVETVTAYVSANDANLKLGNKYILLATKGISNYTSTKAVKAYVGSFVSLEGTIEKENSDKDMVLTITNGPAAPEKSNNNNPGANNENAKSPVETMQAGLAIMNSGADMIAGQSFDNAASAISAEVAQGGSAATMTPFASMGGNKVKLQSGSHVDVKGWNANLGFAKELSNKAGKLLIGPIIEYGRGSYDSYLDNGTHGQGDSHFWGVGVMAKQTNNNGFYYEGSLRAGKVNNDYRSVNLPVNTGYDASAAYWAAHIGAGKVVKVSDKGSLNYYGKYFYSRQGGDKVTATDGTRFDFDAVASSRTRLGVRYTHTINAKNALYVGVAWQHEFDGESKAKYATATISGETPAPSVKGNTGVYELGWKLNAAKSLELDLVAIGYTGKQKGVGVNMQFNWRF